MTMRLSTMSLAGHRAHRRRRRDLEAGLHVRHHAGGGALEPLHLVGGVLAVRRPGGRGDRLRVRRRRRLRGGDRRGGGGGVAGRGDRLGGGGVVGRRRPGRRGRAGATTAGSRVRRWGWSRAGPGPAWAASPRGVGVGAGTASVGARAGFCGAGTACCAASVGTVPRPEVGAGAGRDAAARSPPPRCSRRCRWACSPRRTPTTRGPPRSCPSGTARTARRQAIRWRRMRPHRVWLSLLGHAKFAHFRRGASDRFVGDQVSSNPMPFARDGTTAATGPRARRRVNPPRARIGTSRAGHRRVRECSSDRSRSPRARPAPGLASRAGVPPQVPVR